MILPTNGKVVVFDDKYDDVKNLLGSLSKQKIPYFYFQDEGGNDLPVTPIKNIRLVFLDLELFVDSKATNENIVSAIYGRLSRVLEPNSNYILVYWSTKQEKYGEAVKNAFNNGLSSFKPIISISLDKIATKKANDPIAFLLQNFNQYVNDFKVLKVFSFWENLINDSSGELVNSFVDIINKDENWDDTARYILYKLAIAHSGKQIIKLDEINQVKNAYYTLNQTFIDTIENLISTSIESQKEEFDNVVTSKYEGKDDFSSIINKKLLLSFDDETMEYSGAVSEDINPKSNKVFEYLLNNSFNRKIIEEQIKKEEANKDKTETQIDKLVDKEASKLRKEIRENWRKIYLVVTPLCDYVQKKNYNNRVIKGMIVKSVYRKYIDDKSEAIFISPNFNYVDENSYFIVLNFKYFFTSNDHKGFKDINPIFRVRQQLLSEIQSKLARHVSRQGVLFLD